MKLRLSVLLILSLLLVSGCCKQPRLIVAEPLDQHDREKDSEYCQGYAVQFGVIDMAPVMVGSATTDFLDPQYQLQLYEACMLRKGYRF